MHILALLPEYVTLLVLGQTLSPEWRSLEEHLQWCEACRSEAEGLRDLVAASYTGPLPQTPTPPAPSLAFLRPLFDMQRSRAQTPPPLVFQFSTALLSQIQVRITARSHSVRKRYEHNIAARRAQDPNIKIEIYEHTQSPDLGQVRISVEYAGRSPFDQAGSTVRLQIGDATLSAQTNQNGVVLFGDVPLDQIESWQLSVLPPDSATPVA